MACLADDVGAEAGSAETYGEDGIAMGPITYEHFLKHLQGKKPSVGFEDLLHLEKYNADYMQQK